ncbi:MAG: hypothetical protein AAFQ52_02480 [Chloroflexota bacterium]
MSSLERRLQQLERNEALQVSTLKEATRGYVKLIHACADSWHDELRTVIADERPNLLTDYDAQHDTNALSEFIIEVIYECNQAHRNPLADTQAYRDLQACFDHIHGVAEGIRQDISNAMFILT